MKDKSRQDRVGTEDAIGGAGMGHEKTGRDGDRRGREGGVTTRGDEPRRTATVA
uniref:Uncharacterized protein n=1 Tax=Arundo donax TaxID=35708 RepID=A0A0A8XVZ3_ARUDO